MKKTIVLLAFFIPVLAQAQKPGDIKKYTPDMEVSLVGGIQSYKDFDVVSPVYGVEISLQCPLENAQKSHIRQHFKFTHQQDKKLRSTTIEINPQYMIIAKSRINLGIGPSAGLIFVNIEEARKTKFSYGLGTGAVYYIKHITIGTGLYYTMTNKFSLASSKYETAGTARLNNWSALLKLGYKF